MTHIISRRNVISIENTVRACLARIWLNFTVLKRQNFIRHDRQKHNLFSGLYCVIVCVKVVLKRTVVAD